MHFTILFALRTTYILWCTQPVLHVYRLFSSGRTSRWGVDNPSSRSESNERVPNKFIDFKLFQIPLVLLIMIILSALISICVRHCTVRNWKWCQRVRLLILERIFSLLIMMMLIKNHLTRFLGTIGNVDWILAVTRSFTIWFLVVRNLRGDSTHPFHLMEFCWYNCVIA